MSGRIVLDTNIVIAAFAREPEVLQRIAVAAEVNVPSIVLGELYFGAANSARSLENVDRVRAFASAAKVLVTDAGTAETYGRIRHSLRLRGRPIPENDIWIAALAVQHDALLITRDEHFTEVEDLHTERW